MMDSHVYITGIVTTEVTHKEPRKPRDRFVRYYDDLHHLYGKKVDAETFQQGGQCAFSVIGEQLLDQLTENNFLTELTMLIPAYWSHDYDPDHSNCGPHLQEKYQLNCDMFDIYDQGTLASFTGLHVLQRYLLSGLHQKGMLMALEQTTIPRQLHDHPVLPSSNGGYSLLLESMSNTDPLTSATNLTFKLIDSIIFDSSELHLNKQSSLDVILDLLTQHSLQDKKITIVIKKSCVTWKQIQANMHRNKNDLTRYLYDFISPEPGMLSIGMYLEKIMKKEIECKSNYLILIDEDVETLNVGVLFLEIAMPF